MPLFVVIWLFYGKTIVGAGERWMTLLFVLYLSTALLLNVISSVLLLVHDQFRQTLWLAPPMTLLTVIAYITIIATAFIGDYTDNIDVTYPFGKVVPYGDSGLASSLSMLITVVYYIVSIMLLVYVQRPQRNLEKYNAHSD